MDIKKIGEFLKDLRLEHEMSQEELAEKLFVSRQAVSNWELGKSVPDYDILLKLSDLYNIKVEEILRGKIIYKDKIYRFITNIFSEKSKKKRFIYNTVAFTLFCILCFMGVYFVNTYGKIQFYTLESYNEPGPYSCSNGLIFISNEVALYKNCDLNGFSDKKVYKIKYYYIHNGKERLIESRENSEGIDMNNIPTGIVNDNLDYNEYFVYKDFNKYKDNIYVDIVTEDETITLKLYSVNYYSSSKFFQK